MIIKYNNKVVTHNDKWIGYSGEPTPTLPPYTLRLKYKDGVIPTFEYGGTGVQVSSSPNIWDYTYENSNWWYILYNHTDLLEVLGGNTTNVIGMNQMFNGCSSLTSVKLFDTSNVTDMGDMFYNCTSLTTVPLFDTSKVRNMAGMFHYCSSLTTVPLFNTSNVTDMSTMFYNCTSLTNVPLFNTSNVTVMSGMFQACTSLTSVPLFDTSNVTKIGLMFKGCSSLTSVPLFDTSNVYYMEQMFNGCTGVESGALALYQQASSQANPPSYHYWTFHDCGSNTQTGSAELAQIPSDWK